MAQSTEGILAALAGSSPEACTAALTSVLRFAYAAGRHTRAVTRAVMQVAANSDLPVPARLLAYEILWACVSSADVHAYRAFLSLARRDAASADASELSHAAAATLACAPQHALIDGLLAEDAERALADGMSGDAPAYVRAACVRAFGRMAVRVYVCVAVADAAHADAHMAGRAFDSVRAGARTRTVMFDKCMTVLKAVLRACEDADADVASVAFRVVAYLCTLTHVPTAGRTLTTQLGDALAHTRRLRSTWVATDSLLNRQSTPDAAVACSAVLRAAHAQLLREVARRAVTRLGSIMAQIPRLRVGARADAYRAITVLIASMLAESAAGGVGGGGPVELPSLVRQDHTAPGAEPTVVQLAVEWMSQYLVPAASAAGGLGLSGIGAGDAASAAPLPSWAQSTPPTAFSSASVFTTLAGDAGTASAAAAAAAEAARCFTQLAATFAPHAALHTRADVNVAASRSDSAGHARPAGGLMLALGRLAVATDAASDLRGATGRPAPSAAAVGLVDGIAAGAFVTDSTSSVLQPPALDVNADVPFETIAGPLWDVVGGDAVTAAASVSSSSLLPAVDVCVPRVFAGILQLLRRVATSGASAGVMVATAGYAATDASPSTPSGSPIDVAASSSVNTVSPGLGLGTGAGSPLLTDGALVPLLSLAISLCALMPSRTVLFVAPALLREIGRLGDDVVDDVGAGRHHSYRRCDLLLRLWAIVVYVVQHEVAPADALTGYVSSASMTPPTAARQASAADATNSGAPSTPRRANTIGHRHASSDIGTGVAVAASTGPAALTTLLSRIAYEATRPLIPCSQQDMPATILSAVHAMSATGAAHAAEVAITSTRFRCEVLATMLQSIARTAPSVSVLTRVIDVAAGRDAPSRSTVPARVQDATALHHWLTLAIDSVANALWLIEHRLSYGGIGTMAKDAAATALARIMGTPDQPALAPAAVPHAPPTSVYADDPSSGITSATSGRGPSRTSVAGVSSAFGASSHVTGWAWSREYEATVEASDCLMNVLLAVAALLFPPPLPSTFFPAEHVASSASLDCALALDVLPPALLALHRARFQRLMYACSKMELGVYRMYELERAAQALAPRIISAASSSAATRMSASVTRGTTYDVLPSALPLQLRLLWLLTAAWDGSDGGASTASGASHAAAHALLAVSASDALLRSATLTSASMQAALKSALQHAPRSAASKALETALSHEDGASTLALEALRQKRLNILLHTLTGEAGVALGVGADLEVAAANAIELAASIAAKGGDAHGSGGRSHAGLAAFTSSRGAAAPSASTPAPVAAAAPAPESSSGWLRGSKLGKALGFFGAAKEAAKEEKVEPLVYTGDGTVVTYAHFWLLIDMLVQLAASQRCIAGSVKRSIECMLVQPKLSPDVSAVLLAALPRVSAYAAAYGRSVIARELMVLDVGSSGAAGPRTGGSASLGGAALRTATSSAGILAAVAGEAAQCARDPWSLTLYTPHRAIDFDGTLRDVTSSKHVSAMLDRLAALRKAATIATAAGVGTTAADLVADATTPPVLALVAAASAPELTQNVTLGLNRSVASAACMRTIPPLALLHGDDAGTATAAMALHARWRGWRGEFRTSAASDVKTAAQILPTEYRGSVPVSLIRAAKALASDPALGSAQAAIGDPESIARLLASVTTAASCTLHPSAAPASKAACASWSAPLCRERVVLDTAFNLLADDDVIRDAAALDVATAATGAQAPSTQAGFGLRPSLDALASDGGTVLSSSSDPLAIVASHTVHPLQNRVTLQVSITNHTGLRLPGGMRISLQVGGCFVFDRSAITSAMLLSAQNRLGAAASPSPSGTTSMGAAAVGHALAGDFIFMQRGSFHHATHVVSRPVPPGATVSYTAVVAVSGFGTGTLRVVTVFDAVEAEEGASEDSISGATALAIRSTRVVGACAAEDAVGRGESEEDIDWSRVGTGIGGVNSAWAADLLPGDTNAGPGPLGDGLIWSGPELNAPRKGHQLAGLTSPGLSISRYSANKAGSGAIAPGTSSPAVTSAAQTMSGGVPSGGTADSVMREWSARDSVGVASSVGSPIRPRRGSGAASMAGTAVDRGDKDSDGGSAFGGTGGGDDDVSSVTASDTGAASVAATDGAAAFALDADSAAVAARPYRVRRLEIASTTYAVPSWTLLLHPQRYQLPRAVALAIAVGCDVQAGAATGFGAFGVPSLLAAAAIDGGGMPSPAILSGGALASASGSVTSISNAMFASVCARLPYVHFAVATSHVLQGVPGPVPPSVSVSGLGGVRVASPAWIAAVFTAGLGRHWAPFPLPLCPPLHEASASAAGVVDVAQVAFTASTCGGASLMLFVTAALTHVGHPSAFSESKTAENPTGAQPLVWQLSVQLRTDDARVRAAIAADMPAFVHDASLGRFLVVTHGHAPASVSILQKLDAIHELHAVIGGPSVAEFTPLASAAKSALLLSAQRPSEAQYVDALPTSVFTVLPDHMVDIAAPEPTLAAQQRQQILQALQEDRAALAEHVSKAPTDPFGTPGDSGVATMRLDDFFGSPAPGPAPSPASGPASRPFVRSGLPPAPSRAHKK